VDSPIPVCNVEHRLNIRHPDQFLIFKIFNNAAQCVSAIGCPGQKGMDADRNDSGLPLGLGPRGCRARENFLRDRQHSYKVAAR